ncbi:MAG: hypothetical protein IKP31_02660 [Lachnospiraceae bacterium]|nr:hypothetical protein [Lachnospiraceae bacterium]
MKIKKSFEIFAMLICLAFMLSACGRNKKPGMQLPENGRTVKEEDAADENKQEDVKDDPDNSKDEDKEGSADKSGDLKKNNARARRAYNSFFADADLAVSDVDVEGMLRKGNRYSFSEIIDAYIARESQYFGPDDDPVRLTDATYAYIDCGADGSVELAVNLNYTIYGDYNYILFLRFDDGDVHLFGTDEWGYRSYLNVNEYGYVDSGGSGGANLHIDEYYYFNSDCERIYLYSEETLMGMDTPRVPKYYLKGSYERNDYPDDSFEVDGYTVYTVNFREFEYDENMTEDNTYESYYKDQLYSFEDANGRPVNPDKDIAELYKKEGVKWYSYDELNEIVDKHQDELGAVVKIRNSEEAQWESIVDLGVMEHPVYGRSEGEEISEEASGPKVYVIMDDHDKPYLNPDNPYIDHEYNAITLKQTSCRENQITDTAEWFARAGTTESGTYFYDDNYYYRLTGDAGYGTMTHIEISSKSTGEFLYDFDFSDFLYEDGYEGNDYVDRGIYNCFITDNLLYLNISHRTYSDDCPVNAFMMCVDIDSGEVMWISKPLVSNSSDFARYGDNMITGYGFTAEDDFIYILNRYTGEISEKIKVKKSPDHFAFVDHDLWVRTYSYDYEFDIIEK